MKLRWKMAQKAEIIWWQNYLKKRSPEEYASWKKKYWNTFLEDNNIKLKPLESVLDAGCGPAGIFTILDDQVVDAIDPLLQEFDSNLDHFTPHDFPYVQFFAIPLEKIEYENKYDTIFCLNAINHVSDIDKCLKNLFLALKPNGKLILTVDVHRNNLLKRVFQTVPGDILHPHQFDLKDYKNMIKSVGFTIEKDYLIKKESIFNYHYFCLSKI